MNGVTGMDWRCLMCGSVFWRHQCHAMPGWVALMVARRYQWVTSNQVPQVGVEPTAYGLKVRSSDR